MPDTRSYVAANFSLSLDGLACGFLKSIEGGGVKAEVLVQPARGGAVKKSLGSRTYEPIELRAGFGLAPVLYQWMAASWARKPPTMSGSIVTSSADLTARAELQFTDALITETTFPALDAAGKDPGYLTVRLQPGSTRWPKPSGKVPATAKPAAQKQFLPSSFRLELDGLDCTKVSKIDAFTVRRSGDGVLDFPNLAVTLAESSAATWTAWHEDFVVQGRDDDASEQSGAIVLLAPNLKTELARVTLHNVGIFELRRPQAIGETAARVIAGLYCERMELVLPKG